MANILLIEDDAEISFILSEFLKRNNYTVSAYASGISAVEALSSNSYDLILLDLMLPDISGEKILVHIKRKKEQPPVIIISAKIQPEKKIDLLRSGADDYITKPFYYEEVLARIEAVLRRCSSSNKDFYEYKDIYLNCKAHTVTINNNNLTLTNTEYKILELFLKHPRQILTKENLYEIIWEKQYFPDDNTLNVHISKLRKKLEELGNYSPYIDTIWGIGYRLKIFP